MKIIAKNRRAKHDYELSDRFKAGLVLAGHEVKSVKSGSVSLKGSFIHLSNNEAFLVNAHIRLYSQAKNITHHDPTRERKLLLTKKELALLTEAKQARGMTIVPLAIGTERGLIKLEIATGKGKKLYDKRQAAKAKAMKRDNLLDMKKQKNT
ncbi:SsrA-binding protein SmpB [Candidatus Saccharibacteria bacterium]|nr:SsrA-binding protein SmpB [Candidatus Saccharibacteria bacterium]